MISYLISAAILGAVRAGFVAKRKKTGKNRLKKRKRHFSDVANGRMLLSERDVVSVWDNRKSNSLFGATNADATPNNTLTDKLRLSHAFMA